MHSISIQAIILAAGRSKRFNTGNTKLLEKLCGQEMILYPTKLCAHMNFPLTFVVGYQAERICTVIEQALPDINVEFVTQEEQLGTGHALKITEPSWCADNLLIINGDCPLINKQFIHELIETHVTTQATITFITSHYIDTNNQYGKVVEENGHIKIVEASDVESHIENCCINGGIYLISTRFLKENIHQLTPSKTTGELYITELIERASAQGLLVKTVSAPFDSIRGINTPKELWSAQHIKKSELISYWMDHGVIFSCPQSVQLDVNITIGSGTHIAAGVHILNGTKIGENCQIGPFSILNHVDIHDNVIIQSHCVVEDSFISQRSKVGPFARIRNNSIISEGSTIGNFVEISQSILGPKTKAKHLTYLGNTITGEAVNIGAGTITCNYNGYAKKTTTIQDKAFIGSNNTLIAPVTVEKHSYTAAGSVITKDVPENALAIARARQINKEGYAKQIKERNEQNEEDHQELFIGATKTINDTLHDE